MTESEKFVSKPAEDIWAVSSRGRRKGVILVPHRNQRGKHAGAYIASMTRFEADYVPVRDPDRLKEYAARGYGIRMSPKGATGAASLIMPESITGWRKSESAI